MQRITGGGLAFLFSGVGAWVDDGARPATAARGRLTSVGECVAHAQVVRDRDRERSLADPDESSSAGAHPVGGGGWVCAPLRYRATTTATHPFPFRCAPLVSTSSTATQHVPFGRGLRVMRSWHF